MYLHHVAAYLPEAIVTNAHFTRLNGLADDWIIERTGIRERRKAAPGENANTMAIAATRAALAAAPAFAQASIDLIVAGTYTPHDTIFTVAHAVQRDLETDGVVAQTVPPRVDYSLTEQGQRVRPIFAELLSWGIQYLGRGH